MSSNTKGEGEIRSGLIKANLVGMHGRLARPALYQRADTGLHLVPDQNETKGEAEERAFRDRTGEVLFIDARKLGYMVDRVLRAFTDEDTEKIVSTFHARKRGPM